ncbi:MAG: MotA/TolQ/ExbB proton channel family protein [Chromatiales bacterium]|nr:MotA/TolQ/ExbB proton channel family protein [Chromatiales bacterium]
MNPIEVMMYEIARVFLLPVLLIILGLFCYAFFVLGSFLIEAWQRRDPNKRRAVCRLRRSVGAGGVVDSEALQLRILQLLEPLRISTRTAPMLGLVATMIPLAPALLALGDGDLAVVGQNLVVAFAAVILALLSASITFLVLSVRRRWLLAALHELEAEAGQPS